MEDKHLELGYNAEYKQNMRKNDEENTIRKKTWKMLKMDMLEDGHIQLQAKKKLKIQATEFECCY